MFILLDLFKTTLKLPDKSARLISIAKSNEETWNIRAQQLVFAQIQSRTDSIHRLRLYSS